MSHASIICFEHCCGTGAETGTAGTATFCLSGTGIGTSMHLGSGSGSSIKIIQKSKNQKLEASFLGNNSASRMEKAKFYNKNLLLKNCAK
jgi:hypothetical protein